ncbi:MAG TPA: hypothetical protein VLF69_04080 [Candidatus Saccharimonadales bacterium]|nr:hypothetical protein [Candidatus Saccharimonadales bacterium]
MADFEKNIDTGTACVDGSGAEPAGQYSANLYHVTGDGKTVRRQLGIDASSLDIADPLQVIQAAREAARPAYGAIGRDQVVALALLRWCWRREHADPSVRSQLALERVASLVVVNSLDGYKFKELAQPWDESNVDASGIGRVRVGIAGSTNSRPAVCLPTTGVERAMYPVRFRLLTVRRGNAAQMPSVIVHGPPGYTLEQRVLRSDLSVALGR